MALTNEQRAEINRTNAQKSTGPKSAEGKANSAKNALKHGLTARTFTVVPGEDLTEHQDFLQGWLDAYQPATPGRQALVERGADIAWKLRRLARGDDARAAQRAREAVAAFDLGELRRAEMLGELLRQDQAATLLAELAPSPTATSRRGKTAPVPPPNPAFLTKELETFAAGTRWKIERWKDLRALAASDAYWDWDALHLAVRLLGEQPENVMLNPMIRNLFLISCAANMNKIDFIDEVRRAIRAYPSRSENNFRAIELTVDEPMKQEDAQRRLVKLTEIEINRLNALLPALEAVADTARAEAPFRALCDPSAVSAPLQRYEQALDRSLRQTLAALDVTCRDESMFTSDEPFADCFEPEPSADVSSAEPVPDPAPDEVAAEPASEPAAAPASASAAAPSVNTPRRNEANPPAAAPPAPTGSQPPSDWHPPLIWAA
jgi:hypothetical protein